VTLQEGGDLLGVCRRSRRVSGDRGADEENERGQGEQGPVGWNHASYQQSNWSDYFRGGLTAVTAARLGE
jgi:hypothetical protein